MDTLLLYGTASQSPPITTTKMTILTDCDGVLLDWEARFHPWMKQKGYRMTNTPSYQIHEQYSISYELSQELILRFNESAHIGFLPPLRDAIPFVRDLVSRHDIRFHCITSLGSDLFSQVLRNRNLEMLFGLKTFERISCLECGAPKDEILAEYGGSGFFWIEDKVENAECGLKYGLQPLLFTHTYNCNTLISSGIRRVNSWEDVYKIVT